MNDATYLTNTSDRISIVFCLDVSPSMGWTIGDNSTPIELLNAAVKNFVEELQKDAKTRAAAEVAFVTFSTNLEMDTEFVSAAKLEVPTFKPVKEGGTRTAQAVLRSFEKINKRREQLDDMEIHYYAPFFVMVTDGNPDKNDDPALTSKALSLVRSHCDSHVGAEEIIVPFIIGVGDRVDATTLSDYAAGFTDGYFPIKGSAGQIKKNFNEVFKFIGNSTKKSVHLNDTNQEIIREIKVTMRDLYNDIFNE